MTAPFNKGVEGRGLRRADTEVRPYKRPRRRV
nr:MAG TPA: hypothetical protein [Caudoviricetes sp.]